MHRLKMLLLAIFVGWVSTGVSAQEWTADRLRGEVHQFQNGGWVPLSRGDVVADGGKVRTGSDGRVELVRGEERIDLAPLTAIALKDALGRKMTTIIQSQGLVAITAEKRNVQHFSVQTPILAALVKGTEFKVIYQNGLATVDVSSGVVEVRDLVRGAAIDVMPGQSAAASQARPLRLTGAVSEENAMVSGDAPSARAAVPAVRALAERSSDNMVVASGVGAQSGNTAVNVVGGSPGIEVNLGSAHLDVGAGILGINLSLLGQ